MCLLWTMRLFSINAKDGSSFTVDPTISLKIVDGKSPEVFKKYRKDNILDVVNTTLYNYVKKRIPYTTQ